MAFLVTHGAGSHQGDHQLSGKTIVCVGGGHAEGSGRGRREGRERVEDGRETKGWRRGGGEVGEGKERR